MTNVVFDEASAARIAKAVKWVEQYSLDESNDSNDDTDPGAESSTRRIIRGEFSGEWVEGDEKDVDFVADNGNPATKTATNYFGDVGTANATTNCVIALAGSQWVLVTVSPKNKVFVSGVNSSGDVVTSMSGTVLSEVESSRTSTVLTNATLSPSGTVVTSVSCSGGNLTITTASIASLIGNLTLSAESIGHTYSFTQQDASNLTTKTSVDQLIDINSDTLAAYDAQ